MPAIARPIIFLVRFQEVHVQQTCEGGKDREAAITEPHDDRKSVTIFRIEVLLKKTSPKIWRCIEVSSKTSLDQFHRILQIVMGWKNCHLHEFHFGGRRYGVPHPQFDLSGRVLSEDSVLLSDALPQPGSKIDYLYDLRCQWIHGLSLMERVEPGPKSIYPRLLEGKNSCPPEDCGGPAGYSELKRILKQPSDHTDDLSNAVRNWAHETGFDPSIFLLDNAIVELRNETNRTLVGAAHSVPQ